MLKKVVINRMIKIIIIMVVLVVIMVSILVMVSGIFKTPKYLEPWKKEYSQKFDDPRIKLVANGLLAANGHNMQPWKIKLDDNNKMAFYLYVDADKLTKEVDPFARQTMISQGTFLEYVRVAGENFGYKTDIDLFPNGDYDENKLSESMKSKPVAKVTLSNKVAKASSLYDYMFLADTNRGEYKNINLSDEEISKLENINHDKEIEIKYFTDKTNMKKLDEYVMEGIKIEMNIHRINEETSKIFRSNENEKNRYATGFAVEGQGTSGIMKHILQGAITLVPSINNEKSLTESSIKSTKKAVDNTSAYGMIITKDNSRKSQVVSGMVYSRLILTAHSVGIVMQPTSQVLEEYNEMAEQYKKIHGEYGGEGNTIQMLLRLGKPTKEFPQSMRQDVMNLIVK